MNSRAGLTHSFVGIETPNKDSLRETRKKQNVGVDLVAQIEKMLAHGIGVLAGLIVGFDSNGLDIFERQYEFPMASAVPIFLSTRDYAEILDYEFKARRERSLDAEKTVLMFLKSSQRI